MKKESFQSWVKKDDCMLTLSNKTLSGTQYLFSEFIIGMSLHVRHEQADKDTEINTQEVLKDNTV
jgi:hypothetical protein